MRPSIDAGQLRERLQVLELARADQKTWTWKCVRMAPGHVELGTGNNLFSSVGIGARDCSLVLRAQPLTLDQALRWGDQHIFLTSIQPGIDRGHLAVRGALVDLVDCVADVHGPESGQLKFPAVLTEKYVRYGQPDPYATNQITYVLVTPAVVDLQRGGLVTVAGVNYVVQTAHVLDPHKREYEILRTDDL